MKKNCASCGHEVEPRKPCPNCGAGKAWRYYQFFLVLIGVLFFLSLLWDKSGLGSY
jgi:hypothetical protein